ncbi:low molecular weight protein-tyrosine-phosphatase [Acinetobacter larvae]|uniref:protein-tyrosine-phosphatase n=1 Tax=Acinetobacter larvae TaxID=1789224 RepID=A0A1B2LVN4_9GAMM|nr:low molecular weight protein-tyrosine-phosphatase [Acinetobacter larvae]AOA56987.1 protein tyrosine phosphatase [Acinetobacter larvae]
MQIQNILIVCMGNICRSPMAEYFLKQQFPKRHIYSAGIAALVAQAADQKSILAMQNFGIDIQQHRARQLQLEHLKTAELILVMSKRQQQLLETKWPFIKGRVFRLGHWQNANVEDPYQQDQIIFDQTCKQIKAYLADWQEHL